MNTSALMQAATSGAMEARPAAIVRLPIAAPQTAAHSLLAELEATPLMMGGVARRYLSDAIRLVAETESPMVSVDDQATKLYQATLRIAGAVLELGWSSRRRRPQGSTWDLLGKIQKGQWQKWARQGQCFSAHYRDWGAGTRMATEGDCHSLRLLVKDFFFAVQGAYSERELAA